MRQVLISLKPYWYALIAEGHKTIEVRHTFPQAKDWDGTVYCYMTKDTKSLNLIPEPLRDKYARIMGKVGMKLTVRKQPWDMFADRSQSHDVVVFSYNGVLPEANTQYRLIGSTCITVSGIVDYALSGKEDGTTEKTLKGWDIHSSYELPRLPTRFFTGLDGKPVATAPQSWRYVKSFNKDGENENVCI